MFNLPMTLLRNFRTLQHMAMQVQNAQPDGWKLYVTEEEYAYIKRRRNQNPGLYRRLMNRITVLNSRVSLFVAA